MNRYANRANQSRAWYMALQTWMELWKQAILAEVLVLSAQAAVA
jgi:hypothetical protein